MNWQYAYTPLIWPSFITSLFLIALLIFTWQRRNTPGARAFAVACFFGLVWQLGSMLEYTAVHPSVKIFWHKFQGVIQLPSVTAITCFILEYTWPGRWLTRRNLVLLISVPFLFLGFALTNDLHHLVWQGFEYDRVLNPIRGPINWGFIAYAYGLSLLNFTVLGWLFIKSAAHRWSAALIIGGQLIARVVYLLNVTNTVRTELPLDSLSVAMVYPIYVIAMFGLRIFDPVHIARQRAVDQIQIGIVVLDSIGRIASLNPAAEHLFSTTDKRAKGQGIKQYLPDFPNDQLPHSNETEIEINLVKGSSSRHYNMVISKLKDFRGLEIGCLLLLHDITQQKQNQTKLMEQMWTQATLQEREQLANELHDNIAQSLAFLNLQAQTAQVFLQSEKPDQAKTSLNRLIEATDQVQDDTRGLIGDLLAVNLPAANFCVSLRQILKHFEEQTGLPAHLEIGPGLEECFDPNQFPASKAVQLIRIVQEALRNVQKHAHGAQHVRVKLSVVEDHVMLSILDDGEGFDPDKPRDDRTRFGLQVMYQRAARIGAEIAFTSAPKEGTLVKVSLPMNPEQHLQRRGL